MKENKSTCCNNYSKPSCCPKKDNNCCNKANLNNAEEIRKEVSKTYGQIAKNEGQCNCKSKKYAISLGYTEEDISEENFIVGNLSCGNPVGLASLKEGETVMDLGCGKGFDCRLASKKVGPKGNVVGIDMTKEMIEKAIEVTKKEKVLKGVFYVLKNGGRLIFSDPVALKPIPEEIRKDMKSYTSCMANASLIDDLNTILKNAGFKDVRIEVKDGDSYIRKWTPESKWENGNNPKEYIATASIFAYKN